MTFKRVVGDFQNLNMWSLTNADIYYLTLDDDHDANSCKRKYNYGKN